MRPLYLLGLLALLLWRLVDLFDELFSGAVKMTLGERVITGEPALVIQLLIIAVLAFAMYSAVRYLR